MISSVSMLRSGDRRAPCRSPGSWTRGSRRRGDEGAVGVPGAVEALRVHERGALGEAVNLAQKLRHGDRKAQVDERLRDLAVADTKGAVARHSGDDALPRMNDAEVVQARDVEAVADELRQLLDGVGLTGSNRERVRDGPGVAPFDRRRVSGCGGAVPRPHRGCSIPDNAAGA